MPPPARHQLRLRRSSPMREAPGAKDRPPASPAALACANDLGGVAAQNQHETLATVFIQATLNAISTSCAHPLPIERLSALVMMCFFFGFILPDLTQEVEGHLLPVPQQKGSSSSFPHRPICLRILLCFSLHL